MSLVLVITINILLIFPINSIFLLGNLTSFILYAAYVGIGFNGVSTFYAEMMKALGASTRLWNIVDRFPMIPVDQGAVPDKLLSGNIQFDNVDFSYPTRSENLVLNKFCLNVPADHIMAVVGGSGSGKQLKLVLWISEYCNFSKKKIYLQEKVP